MSARVWVGSGARDRKDRARPNISILTYAKARMECRPHSGRLSHLIVCMKARNQGSIGRAKLQHRLVRVGTGGGLVQAKLQHLMAKPMMGDGLCLAESEQSLTHAKYVTENRSGIAWWRGSL